MNRASPSLEELEPRRLLSSYHFDFGTASSPVFPGYTRVPLTAYSAQQGYGWASLSGLSARSESTGNSLTSDFHTGNDDMFLVDLPNGSYDLMPSVGDSQAGHTVAMWAQGQELSTGLTTVAGQYAHPTYRVSVSNGQLAFRIAAVGGAGASFALDGLDINVGSGTFEHMDWNQMTTRPNADIANPNVGGAEIHVPWAMVEPSKGVFDWSELDTLLRIWGGAGKKITLVIKTSPDGAESNPYQYSATPAWVYAEGAQPVTTNKLGIAQQLPVLWDPVFLEEYQRFVQQFAARYDGNPAIEYVIVGPGVFSSTRSFYQGQPNAFQPLGYTEPLWYQANQRIVGFYQSAFQMTHLALGMAPFDDSNNPDPQYNEFTLAQWAAKQGLYLYYHNLYGNSTWVNSPYPAFFASLGTTTKVALGMDNPTSTNSTYYQTYGGPVPCTQYAFGGGSTGLPAINTYYLEWYTLDVDAGTQGNASYQKHYGNALAQAAQAFVKADVTGQAAPGGQNPTSYDGWDGFTTPLVNVGGTLYFADNNGSQGNVLWKNDGSAAGSLPVQNLNSHTLAWAPQNLTNVSGELFFTASDRVDGVELWKSDGTDAGTRMVADINPGTADSQPSFLTNVNGELFFSADDGTDGPQLWKSNGTTAGTVMVSRLADPAANVFPYDLTAVGGKVFFVADDGVHGPQLWQSDGTTGGTFMVKAVNANNGTGPTNLTALGSELFFAADDGTHGRQLWRSDGTAAGTQQVQAINAGGNDSEPEYLTNVNGTLLFGAYNGVTDGLWKSDGTAVGTTLLAALTPGGTPLNPAGLTAVNGAVFFAAGDPTAGYDLWKSDGTVAGTSPVLRLNPAGLARSPYGLVNVNGTLFFAGSDNAPTGTELWKSDGTAAGTVLVEDINPGAGSSFPANLTNVHGTAFFWANDGMHGLQLWKWNTNPVSQFSLTGPGTSTAGNYFPVTVTALDRYGDTGPVYGRTVHFTSSDAAATLPADYTFTAADGGVHTFLMLSLDTAGNQNVIVTDSSRGGVTGGAAVLVTPASLRHLVVTGPATVTAGSTFVVTVTAVDVFGNTVPSYRGKVWFQSPDGGATLPASYTFTASDAGVHTFSGVTLVRAGAEAVTAVDTATGWVRGTVSVTVLPSPATHFTVNAPPTATAGSPISVTVTALDQFGNVATDYAGAVALASSDSAAVLPRRYTFTGADRGVHTFTVTHKTAAVQTITARDAHAARITGQDQLHVYSAGATHFSVTVANPNPKPGQAITLIVLALDPYGNTDTSYRGRVHFTSTDPRAKLPADYAFTAADLGRRVFAKVVTLNTVGTQLIVITDRANSAITGSVSVSV
jgi:ELWxxDGT repeat protein